MSASGIASYVGIMAVFVATSCGDSTSGPTETTLTGRWAGSGTYTETGTACEGEAAIVLQLTQTGQGLTGTLQGTVTRASAACLAATGQSLSGQLTGTVTAGAVNFTADGPIQFTGSVTGSSISGTFDGRFLGLIAVTGRWTATRQ